MRRRPNPLIDTVQQNVITTISREAKLTKGKARARAGKVDEDARPRSRLIPDPRAEVADHAEQSSRRGDYAPWKSASSAI